MLGAVDEDIPVDMGFGSLVKADNAEARRMAGIFY